MRTQTGNAALIELIRSEIRNRGPQPFAWFMEQALYHPEHGYYSSGRCAIGRKGDYFTNVSIGPLFGQLMTAQFAEIWEQLGKIDNFVIVEQGAHDGQFARDVLQSAQLRAPEFFEALDYRIIEPFPILRERQSQMLEPFRNKIEWRDSLEPFTGVHFSNELLDAMPVRLISHGMEKLVGLQGDRFVFIERHCQTRRSIKLRSIGSTDLAANLKRGYVIVIDYGHSGDEFQRDIQVRAQHRHLDSPFDQIGHADITMHVDWTSIARRARGKRIACRRIHRSASFPYRHHLLAVRDPRLDGQSFWRSRRKTKRALQTLLHPEMLGRAFQVLALAKNVDPTAPPPAGFKFAREPHSVLGLGNPN